MEDNVGSANHSFERKQTNKQQQRHKQKEGASLQGFEQTKRDCPLTG